MWTGNWFNQWKLEVFTGCKNCWQAKWTGSDNMQTPPILQRPDDREFLWILNGANWINCSCYFCNASYSDDNHLNISDIIGILRNARVWLSAQWEEKWGRITSRTICNYSRAWTDSVAVEIGQKGTWKLHTKVNLVLVSSLDHGYANIGSPVNFAVHSTCD